MMIVHRGLIDALPLRNAIIPIDPNNNNILFEVSSLVCVATFGSDLISLWRRMTATQGRYFVNVFCSRHVCEQIVCARHSTKIIFLSLYFFIFFYGDR